MENHIEEEVSSSKRNKGFTLVELLIVIVILGILATVTVFAVRGITDKGTTSACNSDKVTLQTAVESYIAQYGGTTIPSNAVIAAGAVFTNSPAVAIGALPATVPAVTWALGADPNGTLVAAGFLRQAPTNLWVASDGKVWYKTGACGAALLGTVAG